MLALGGEVAVVTGASRGVGKGVALGLGEAGATVYVTGRTVEEDRSPTGLPGTIGQTAAEVTQRGGNGIAARCDHGDDSETEALFRRVMAEQGHLDVLVNSVWGGYECMFEDGAFTWPLPFWKQPLWRWDAMFRNGVRAGYVGSSFAARIMVEQRSGLIVNISYWAAQKHVGNTPYGIAKAATDKMTTDMAYELRPENVTVISLYPGLVRSERVIQAREFLDLSNSESPQFIGRAVAALLSDPHIMEKSGKMLVAAALAEEYGFTDIDGKRPRPLTCDEA